MLAIVGIVIAIINAKQIGTSNVFASNAGTKKENGVTFPVSPITMTVF